MKRFTQKLSWMSLALLVITALLNTGCENNGASSQMEKLDLSQQLWCS